MHNQNITLKWDVTTKSSQIQVDEVGIAHVEVPPGAKQFVMLAGPRLGEEPGRIAYRNCNDPSTILYSVSNAVDIGIVPKNICSGRTLPSHPGEVVFWALPKPLIDFQ